MSDDIVDTCRECKKNLAHLNIREGQKGATPWKTNMEPTKSPISKGKWSSKPPWLCSMLIFRGATHSHPVTWICLRCLEHVKYAPKWWFHGLLRWYEVKNHLITNPRYPPYGSKIWGFKFKQGNICFKMICPQLCPNFALTRTFWTCLDLVGIKFPPEMIGKTKHNPTK